MKTIGEILDAPTLPLCLFCRRPDASVREREPRGTNGKGELFAVSCIPVFCCDSCAALAVYRAGLNYEEGT